MAIRGSQVFKELQRALAGVRDQAVALENSASQIDQRVSKLMSERGENFLDLSRLYLPDLSREAIEKTFSEVRGEIQEIARRKQRREQELIASIDQSRQQIDQWQQKTDEVTDDLNEKAAQRDRLQEEVANRLKKIPEYERLTNEAARAEQRLTSNEARMEQMQREAAQKLPSYDNSQLFRYLYARKFGTSDYHYGGLTRRLDQWLANFIGYASARDSYEFLKVTPDLMAAELQRRRDQFNSLMEQIEAMEAKIEQEVGLTDVIVQGDALGKERDALVYQMAERNRQIDLLKSELDELLDSRGRFYDEAMNRMRNHLEKMETELLQQRARQTAEPTDDAIVADIVALNNEMDQLQPEFTQLNRQRNVLVDRQNGLNQIVQRFRSSNFDSSRSVFVNNFNVNAWVERYLNGELNTRSFWRQLRQNQHFEESWAQQQATDIFSDPSSQVLLHTMVELAADALKGAAQRSVYRRRGSASRRGRISLGFPGTRRSSRRPSRPSSSRRSSRPRSGGFTTGNGF